MSLYQFFTSHEPNYIHKSIYVRVSKADGRWVLSKSRSGAHTSPEGQSPVPSTPSEGTAASKHFCKKLR